MENSAYINCAERLLKDLRDNLQNPEVVFDDNGYCEVELENIPFSLLHDAEQDCLCIQGRIGKIGAMQSRMGTMQSIMSANSMRQKSMAGGIVGLSARGTTLYLSYRLKLAEERDIPNNALSNLMPGLVEMVQSASSLANMRSTNARHTLRQGKVAGAAG